MLRSIFLIVIFVCLCPFLSAVAQGQSESKIFGKPELERFLTDYVKLQNLRSSFLQKKTIAELKLELISTGTLIVDKDKIKNTHSVVWTIEKPSFLEVRMDEKNIHMTTLNGKKRQTQTVPLSQMSSQQGAQGLSLLVPLLEMDAEKLLAHYAIQEVKPQQLRLSPKTRSLFKTIDLSVGLNKQVSALRFIEKNGDSIDITFKALKN
ncbi:MAG: outer membrane lipoprotein carrier protein LolA [Bdellovibrionaceae bacterium]|nr:outer membrane lipoprotein carrier protein LolA [Pseudobdellovibrionaceae bacterium]